jgi:hypothetical protein
MPDALKMRRDEIDENDWVKSSVIEESLNNLELLEETKGFH